MRKNTKEKLLDEAEKLFSQKGFYGASINDVAGEVGVSKQALLHHFSSKEKLYGAVLQRAADKLMGVVKEAKAATELPAEQLSKAFGVMNRPDDDLLRVIILLLRELLDNRDRAEHAHKWFLRPYLDELVGMVEAAQKDGAFKGVAPFAFVYSLLGETQYYLVSLPTLKQLYSDGEFAEHQRDMLALIDAKLTS